MKLDACGKPLVVDKELEAYDFSIDDEDAAHVISMLSDKLYSDKVLAVVREYMANGFDACVESGTQRPIEVTVPNTFNPTFAVRDFGFGLSKDDVTNVFIKVGKSTKRDTNDTVGAFGIGAKAFRAYGDVLNIVSIHDGIKTVYTAQKTENKGNRLFVIGQEATTEPSGIEVSLPVNPKDIREFERKILELSKFFEIPPILKGTSKSIPKVEKKVSGNGWFEFKDESSWGNTSYILMGNIPYPINMNMLEIDEQQFLRRINLCFCSAIGQVDIAPDREKLEYTSKTKRYIKKVVLSARAEFVQRFKDSVQNAPSYLEACEMVYCRSKELIPSKDLEGLKYKGESLVLEQRLHKVVKDQNGLQKVVPLFDIDLKGINVYNGRMTQHEQNSWRFDGTDTVIFVNTRVSYSIQRTKQYWEKNNLRGKHYLVFADDEKEVKKFLAAINSHQFKERIVWVRDLPFDKTKRVGNSTAHIRTFLFRGNSHRARDGWKEAKDVSETEKKFFVPICRFEWTKGNRAALLSYSRFFTFLGEGFPIYGIRTADVKNLDSTWVELTHDFFQERFNTWKDSLPADIYDADYKVGVTLTPDSIEQAFKGLGRTSEVDEFLKIAKRTKELREKYEKEREVLVSIEGTHASGKSTEKLEKEIKKQYPLLESMLDRYYWFQDGQCKRYLSLENYAKGIDKTPVLT